MSQSAMLVASFLILHASGQQHHPRWNPFIVGGEDAKPGEIPFQVSFQFKNPELHYCGGSIYNEQWVITAGHCTGPSGDIDPDGEYGFQILAGQNNLAQPDGNGQKILVAKVIQHPNYEAPHNPPALDGDISLLKLRTPLKFNDYVQPIKIPPQGYKAESEFQVSGWGKTEPQFANRFRLKPLSPNPANLSLPDVLQKVKVPFITDKVCQDAYYPNMTVLEQEICAGDLENGGIDSCKGDSGGPLVEIKTGYLAGVVSWGFGCALPGYPGVYAEVAYYTDWIEETIKNNS